MSSQTAIPVFVLGLQRSGTTLAANLLAAQPGIAAVAAKHHQG
ncbi:MAG: sulfotransferase, partial [Leisingera sp.]